jgi:hypothetical protein
VKLVCPIRRMVCGHGLFGSAAKILPDPGAGCTSSSSGSGSAESEANRLPEASGSAAAPVFKQVRRSMGRDLVSVWDGLISSPM